MKTFISYTLLYLFIAIQAINAQNVEQIVLGKKHSLQSDILSEQRDYWISFPESYNDELKSYKKYPLLILLDGHIHFKSVSGAVQFMSAGYKCQNRY